MISERISDNIFPQMKILNMVIPILTHICSLSSNLSVATHKAARLSAKRDIINEVKLFSTVYFGPYKLEVSHLPSETIFLHFFFNDKRKCGVENSK